MCAKPDQADQRERAFAQLIAEALKPAGLSAAASGAACPDAELVAAYADQGLAVGSGKGLLRNDERDQLETHFAACERCQKILAALGAGIEAPAGESVAVMPAPAAPQIAARPSSSSSSRRWLWWLTPAFGAAAAALLWMVLRPASPGRTEAVQTAGNYSQSTGQESRADAPSGVSSSEAETRLRAAPRQRAQALDDLSKAKSAAKESDEPARKQAFAPRAVPETQQAPTAVSETSNAAVPPQAAAVQTMIAPAPAAEQRAVAPPPLARDQAAAANQQAPLQERSMAAIAVPAAPQAAAAPAQAGRGAVAEVSLYTFGPPAGGASWRLGIGGRIKRSTDQGRTWQEQSSGVTTDLIAGSAASSDVAWVIGRGGLILRTTDGEHWERITGPPGVTVEWAAIAAHNAMSATAVAEDLRRFSTEDGGRTWVQQK